MYHDSESAAAYTFIMVIVLIFIAALAYAYLIPSLNVFTKQVNKDIDGGHLSEQTKVTYEWNLNFFSASIGIGLIGFVIFCIVRSIEIAEAGNQ